MPLYKFREKTQLADIMPYCKECYGCYFVSEEGGCNVSYLTGRPRMSFFKNYFGYEGHGGKDCPMRAETPTDYRYKAEKYRVF